MELPDAVEGEVGRVVTITWTKINTASEAEDLTGATITGVIENRPGPDATTRAITGALALVDAANGQFSWTYSAVDTATAGKYNVHFVATIGGVIKKSIPALWEVIRAPTVS